MIHLFLDFQTIQQKLCADSRTVGCNGAVSSSKSILPPCLLRSPSPPPSRSLFLSLSRSGFLLLSLTLYAPSTDENRSPQRMPASHWLSDHRSRCEQKWERERVRRGRRCNSCHSIPTLSWRVWDSQTHPLSSNRAPPLQCSGLKLPPCCHWDELLHWKVKRNNWSRSPSPGLNCFLLTEELLIRSLKSGPTEDSCTWTCRRRCWDESFQPRQTVLWISWSRVAVGAHFRTAVPTVPSCCSWDPLKAARCALGWCDLQPAVFYPTSG